MMAAGGTPIVAPFDGIAVNAKNQIGGNAVKVYGEYGYVYNAHLSAYGQLGPVETGDVIGYVGAPGTRAPTTTTSSGTRTTGRRWTPTRFCSRSASAARRHPPGPMPPR